MIVRTETNNSNQDVVHLLNSIPIPSTAKEAFFPVTEKDSSFTYSTLTDRMKYYNTPGVSIAYIKDYKLQWAQGFGVENIETNQSVTPLTIFEAASTTKFLNTVLILRLEEQGKLSLTENVNNYLHTWKIPENENTSIQPATLLSLLTHKAGLPPTNFSYDDRAYPTLVDVLNGSSPAANAGVEVRYTPGTRFEYSNLDHVVIQFMLEEMLSKSYSKIMKEELFVPLNMNHSYFPDDDYIKTASNLAFPHDEKGIVHVPEYHPSAYGQGWLLTTPSDLAHLAIDIMCSYKGESNRYLSPQSAALLFEHHGDLGDSILGIPISLGLGCFIYEKDEDFMFTHPGYNFPGSLSYFYGYPKTGNGGVVMINGANGEKLSYEIIHALNLIH
jgi:CubicO group peptidase (beta-lactamase class C family)